MCIEYVSVSVTLNKKIIHIFYHHYHNSYNLPDNTFILFPILTTDL